MPEHAADDRDRENGSAAIGPFAKLRSPDTCAAAASDAQSNNQPSDEYRQQAARRCHDLRLERAGKTNPIHTDNLEYIFYGRISGGCR
jgi:hypothetical protein